MGFIGGVLQQRFVERLGSGDRSRALAVPIDVGKHRAAALVCDFLGTIVVEPFWFDLDEEGFARLERQVEDARAGRGAGWIRVGLEEAGHYHRALLSRLLDARLDVVLLNPAQVKQARAEALSRSLKTDQRDLVAMGKLLIRGEGRPAEHPDVAMATQAALVAHRARKVKARTALKNQIQASLDLVFPVCRGASARSSTPRSGACSWPRPSRRSAWYGSAPSASGGSVCAGGCACRGRRPPRWSRRPVGR
jgi:transposase